jgi:hypothetical protein
MVRIMSAPQQHRKATLGKEYIKAINIFVYNSLASNK